MKPEFLKPNLLKTSFDFVLFHKEQEINALRWFSNVGQYQLEGQRERIGKQTLLEAQDQVCEQCWKLCEEATVHLKQKKIPLPQWRAVLSDARAEVHFVQDFILNGGLDSSASATAMTATLSVELITKRLVYKIMDDAYISYLCESLLRGEHGPDFQDGDLDIRAKVLFLECIHVYSPWHEEEFLQNVLTEAQTAYRQGVEDFYSEKKHLETPEQTS